MPLSRPASTLVLMAAVLVLGAAPVRALQRVPAGVLPDYDAAGGLKLEASRTAPMLAAQPAGRRPPRRQRDRLQPVQQRLVDRRPPPEPSPPLRRLRG